MIRLIYVFIAIQCAYSLENFFTDQIDESVELFHNSFESTKSSAKIENYPIGNKTEPARRFLKHYNSLRPVAILVEDNTESHWAAKHFMKNVYEVAPSAKYITFYISKFNMSGASPSTEITGSDAAKIEKTFIYKTNNETSYLGYTKSDGPVIFFAILNAAAVLPQNGAIIIFTDRKPADEDLAGHTGILRKKNLKVYVVWGGPYPTKSNDERLLNELCSYSGGLFLSNGNTDISNYNYRRFIEKESSNLNTSVVLSKTNLTEESEFTFPIDSEVTGIHLTFTPVVTSGTLLSPIGQKINVMKNDEIATYGSGSFGITEPGQREIYLGTTPASQSVGLWRLNLDSTLAVYNVTVFVCTKLTAQAYFIRNNAGLQEVTTNKKKIMKLDFTGYVGSINNISFVDNDGKSLSDAFNVKRDLLVIKDDHTKKNKEIDVEVFNVPRQPFHVVIQGKDIQGNQFSRITYVNEYSYSDIFPQPIVSIEVGLGSEVITTGGRSPTITFEVTNYRTTAADVRFFCKDDQSILGTMTPYRQIISPHQTAIVTLTLSLKYGTYQDTITFSASLGSESVTKKVLVDVGSQITDTTEPSLDYTFLSDCSKVLLSSCDQGTWTIEVRAKDTESGLLHVSSNPKGLYFSEGYTSGTKEEVIGYYSDSCCRANLEITAVDRMINRKTITANAYRAKWGPGQISALVLGILLLIIIIILIVYFVTRCIKKKENYNLPTYRGGKI
ncbi:hypothetical protein JTB14_010377 [Gonioctena quinquepunctata]|nr:hypothetical protein JTB14_010377 [Gonioctena quinquepunctata]